MDKYVIRMRPRAKQDIEAIYMYIYEELQEPTVANDVVEEIDKAISSLEYMPGRCMQLRRSIYAGQGFRQLLVKNYKIIYKFDEEDKTVTIFNIRYAKRLL